VVGSSLSLTLDGWVSVDKVQTLVRPRSRVPFEDESATCCALALSQVAESASSEISAEAFSALESIARKNFRSQEMADQTRELLALVRQRRSNRQS
jgi:hypothetical protein